MSSSLRNESTLDDGSSKEVTARDIVRERYLDTAKARADVEQAVNLFFDALLRPSGLARGPL